MGSIVVHNQRSPNSSASVGSGRGGGGVEDILKRLGNVETHVSESRSQVSAILATIPHLATKSDVSDVRKEVVDLKADLSERIGEVKADLSERIGEVKADLSAQIGEVKADLSAQIGGLRADLSTQVGNVRADLSKQIGEVSAAAATSETAIIKWIIATAIALTAMAFTIAKFVH